MLKQEIKILDITDILQRQKVKHEIAVLKHGYVDLSSEILNILRYFHIKENWEKSDIFMTAALVFFLIRIYFY